MTLTPADLAALHARCFTLPRPWSEAEFRELLAMSDTFLLHRPDAFLLGRSLAGEAELLTLAVAPEDRRRGAARLLTGEFAATSRRTGALTAFLEVAEDNRPARALYAAAGWHEAGRRRGYYAPGLDAIVMRLDLTADQEPG